jgi:hypothetical protein
MDRRLLSRAQNPKELTLDEFKSFEQIPLQSKELTFPVEPSPQLPASFKPTWRPPVVNSLHIKWKPVDKVAALVVAPAKWYEEPPVPPPKFEPIKSMPEKTDSIGPPAGGRMKTKTVLTDEGHRETLIDINSITAAAVDAHDASVKRGLKITEDLTEKARELTAVISYLATESRGPWAEYQSFIKEAIATVREERIALGSETRLLMGALKEVRTFFLEETYEAEIRRLHEFIDLCERLKALKEDGFLDMVADTILKLNS